MVLNVMCYFFLRHGVDNKYMWYLLTLNVSLMHENYKTRTFGV